MFLDTDNSALPPLVASTSALLPELAILADSYGLNWQADYPECGFVLELTPDRLQLRELAPKAAGAVFVDFASAAATHRRKHGGGRGQPVARAMGFREGNVPSPVIDATAGLAGDSFVLASLGAEVWMIERSPVVAALLADGLARGRVHPDVADIVGRMHLRFGQAAHLLSGWEGPQPEAILLDPMFPEKQKKAAVKKEMQAFKTILGGDADADALLAPARRLAKKRVVVKRPRLAPFLDAQKPHASSEGESTRFDIYMPVA